MAIGRTNCGSGGGGGKVDVKAYSSFSALPLVGKANEIAIIANSIGFLTMDSFAPSSPAQGDVWVRISGSDMHKVTLIDSSSQNVTVSIQGVYIYSSGLWVLADAYLWNGAQWSSIPTIFFHGTDRCPSVTGGWTLTSGTGAGSVVDYDNYIKIDGVGCNAQNGGTYHTVNKIDLSEFTTLYVRMRYTGKSGSANGPFFYVKDEYTSSGMYAVTPRYYIGYDTVPGTLQTYSLDVSAETTSKYIIVGCYGAGGSGTMSWEMDKVWGV